MLEHFQVRYVYQRPVVHRTMFVSVKGVSWKIFYTLLQLDLRILENSGGLLCRPCFAKQGILLRKSFGTTFESAQKHDPT